MDLVNVTKTYKIQQKEKGVKGALKSFFIKNYKSVNAVNNLSLCLDKGEILGYIGVNGAGKSTTIKMLTGILIPTDGEVKVLGKNPYKYRKEIAKKIGVVFGQRSQLIWDIPPIDTFNLFSKIYEIPRKQYIETLNYIVDFMGIKDLLDIPVRKLSLGQRMCCEITASLLHKPEILFLDEPTIGLDILNKEKIRNFIKIMNEEYKTSVILTTHDLGDVEKLCDRIVVIDKGSKVYEGSLESVKEEYGTINTIKIEFSDIVTPIDFLDSTINCDLSFGNNMLYVRYNRKNYRTTDLINLIMQKIPNIKDITIVETGIEDIVKKIYQKDECVGCV